jgi:hypothetical protein
VVVKCFFVGYVYQGSFGLLLPLEVYPGVGRDAMHTLMSLYHHFHLLVLIVCFLHSEFRETTKLLVSNLRSRVSTNDAMREHALVQLHTAIRTIPLGALSGHNAQTNASKMEPLDFAILLQ